MVQCSNYRVISTCSIVVALCAMLLRVRWSREMDAYSDYLKEPALIWRNVKENNRERFLCLLEMERGKEPTTMMPFRVNARVLQKKGNFSAWVECCSGELRQDWVFINRAFQTVDGVEDIFTVLESMSMDASANKAVVTEGIEVLIQLLRLKASERRKVYKSRSRLRLIEKVFESNAHVLDISRSLCALVSALANDLASTKSLADSGLLDSIVSALARFADDPELLKSGIKAIDLMSHNRQLRIRATNLGAIEYIIYTMEKYTDDGMLLETCCSAIGSIVRKLPDSKARAAASGIVTVLLRTMREHEHSPKLQKRALFAMVSLTEKYSRLKNRFGKRGIFAILRAMAAHSADQGMQRWACSAVYTFVFKNPGNTAAAKKMGAASKIARALQHFGKSSRELRSTCKEALSLVWKDED
eukprot:g2569.t1